MNMYDSNTQVIMDSFSKEEVLELQRQFRENLKYVETFEGIDVYLQPVLTFELDIHEIASGYATSFDIKDNGVQTPIIILSETANRSRFRKAILWHEHGHHALGHLDGKTGADRIESEELEADMWSYIHNGPEILEWLVEVREHMEKVYDQYTPTLEFFQEHNMTEYTPEELLQETLERQRYALNELDTRIKALS